MKMQRSMKWTNGVRSGLCALALMTGAIACGPAEGGEADLPSDETSLANSGGTTADAGTPPTDAGQTTVVTGQTTTDAGSTTDPGSSCTTDTWTNYAKTFFADSCISCHSWASSYSQVKADATAIRSRIQSGSMPKGQALSSTEKARIIGWIDCGSPQ